MNSEVKKNPANSYDNAYPSLKPRKPPISRKQIPETPAIAPTTGGWSDSCESSSSIFQSKETSSLKRQQNDIQSDHGSSTSILQKTDHESNEEYYQQLPLQGPRLKESDSMPEVGPAPRPEALESNVKEVEIKVINMDRANKLISQMPVINTKSVTDNREDGNTDDEELMRQMLNDFSEQWHSEDENSGDEEMLLREMLPKLDEDGNIDEKDSFGTDWMKAIWKTSDTHDKNNEEELPTEQKEKQLPSVPNAWGVPPSGNTVPVCMPTPPIRVAEPSPPPQAGSGSWANIAKKKTVGMEPRKVAEIKKKPEVVEDTASDQDLYWLKLAISLSRYTTCRDHPFAAILVDSTGQSLAADVNFAFATDDLKYHAERRLLRKVEKLDLDKSRIDGSTIYSSTQPCVECSRAIEEFGVKRIVYGCPKEELMNIRKANRANLGMGNDAYYQTPWHFAIDINMVGPFLKDEATNVHKVYWKAYYAGTRRKNIYNSNPQQMMNQRRDWRMKLQRLWGKDNNYLTRSLLNKSQVRHPDCPDGPDADSPVENPTAPKNTAGNISEKNKVAQVEAEEKVDK